MLSLFPSSFPLFVVTPSPLSTLRHRSIASALTLAAFAAHQFCFFRRYATRQIFQVAAAEILKPQPDFRRGSMYVYVQLTR